MPSLNWIGKSAGVRFAFPHDIRNAAGERIQDGKQWLQLRDVRLYELADDGRLLFSSNRTGGNGGWGGPWGTSGYPGDAASYSSSSGSGSTGQGTAGVPAGYYIDGNDFVTWINTGTRIGRVLA